MSQYPYDVLNRTETIGPGESRLKKLARTGFENATDAILGLIGLGKETPANLAGQMVTAGTPFLGSTRALRALSSLPMDEASRMTRAAEQGFSTPAWHGRTGDFSEFNPAIGRGDFGIHVALESPEAANSIRMSDILNTPGNNVMPLMVKSQKTVDLPDMGMWRDARNWEDVREFSPELFESLPPDIKSTLNDIVTDYANKFPAGTDLAASHNMRFQQDIKDALQKQGYGSIKYRNFVEANGDPSMLLLDPRQIRSKFAAFDPAKVNSRDIMSSALLPLLGYKVADNAKGK